MNNKAGFTLLELIIVITIVTILVSISTIFFANTLPKGKFNAAVRDISATIRSAKTLALISGTNQTFFIDIDEKKYGIDGKGYKEIPSHISIKVIDPFLKEFTEGKYNFLFYGAGGVEGGDILLSDGKRKIRIHVDPIAGSTVVK